MRVLIRRALPAEEGIVEGFLRRLGYGGLLGSLYVLDVEGGPRLDVFEASKDIEPLIGSFRSAYAMGFYLGFIERGSARFAPSLPLAVRLSRYCGRGVKCCVVSYEGERHFLYGKPVYGDNVYKASPGPCIVVNPGGEAAGWGLYRDGRVESLIDLGWYLRRGG